PALERSRPEVLDEDVCVADESLDDLLALGLLQVGGDAALVPRVDLPPQRHVAVEPAEQAYRVAAGGMLHLDHVRAEVGEPRGQPGAGAKRRDIDDLHALQRSTHGLSRTFPNCSRASIILCASAASLSGSVAWIRGFSVPAVIRRMTSSVS